jgi:membrane-anchored protein YejM (alkaline phosphatase superfamily)
MNSTISLIFFFRFTNIEVARVITSTFKSSMEIPLFQWSQVSRYPNGDLISMHGFKDFRLVLTLIPLSFVSYQ